MGKVIDGVSVGCRSDRQTRREPIVLSSASQTRSSSPLPSPAPQCKALRTSCRCTTTSAAPAAPPSSLVYPSITSTTTTPATSPPPRWLTGTPTSAAAAVSATTRPACASASRGTLVTTATLSLPLCKVSIRRLRTNSKAVDFYTNKSDIQKK